MELRLIPASALEEWYREELTQAFPPNECKPLANIRELMDQGRYEVWGLFEGEILLGYATLWMDPEDKRCILLDYRASPPSGGTGAWGRGWSGCWRSGLRAGPCSSLRRSDRWRGTTRWRTPSGSGGWPFMSGAALCPPTIWPPVVCGLPRFCHTCQRIWPPLWPSTGRFTARRGPMYGCRWGRANCPPARRPGWCRRPERVPTGAREERKKDV